MLRADVRRFLREERAAGRFEARPNGWMRHDAAFSARCGGRGFIGLTLPERYGGHGRSALDRYIVCEEMLAAGAPLGAHWIADRQSGPQIARHGSELLKQTVLPRITAGRCCFGIGMSESNAGSDLASVKTRAEQVEGGWRLHGTKLWTSHAHRADYVIVLARTAPAGEDRRSGLSQFVVDMKLPGVHASPIEDLTGGRDFCEVVFDDVAIGADYLLGHPGDGWKLVVGELAFERSGPDRFLSTFPLLGAAAAALAGAANPSACAGIGRMTSHLSALRHMSMGIAATLEAGESPEIEAALTKDLGTTLEQELAEVVRALVRGPAGVPCTPFLREAIDEATLAAPSFSLRGGTREILRGIIARELGMR
ncbi:MAG: acyl-CoA dehydrogenase family protein [Casimicrobiaceae bacterium]